jgi:dethiobiotin synthetase
MPYRSIYVAATGQHVGKTTSTLGLIHALQEQGVNVGYCKPVGQKYVTHAGDRVDKDTALFAQFMEFDIVPEIHSPVILGSGDTVRYLDNPNEFDLKGDIMRASEHLNEKHDIVVFEGTGHPGVGSVAEVSNSVVAQMVSAGLIMVVEAGIGNTIDRLDLNLSVFQHKNIPIIGVIINKTRKDKMKKVRKYVGKKLAERGIPILGVIPYEEELGLPLMESICKAIKGQVMYNGDQLDNKVKDIIAGSLIDMEDLRRFSNQLLVVSVRRFDDALRRIRQFSEQHGLEESPLSGIIITGKGSLKKDQEDYVNAYRIPVLRSFFDTYESVIKISRIEVKINTRTPWKVQKAVELFKNHVDLSPIMERIERM